MKRIDIIRDRPLLILLVLLLVIIPGTAIASSQEWRPTYDRIMMYVNFAIIAAVIFKYARDPFKAFLKQQKADVVDEIDMLKTEKKRIADEIEAARTRSTDNQQRLEKMKARLIAQGKTKKQQLIDQAQRQSVIMIEESRKKMVNRIRQAKHQLKLELADLAFEEAKQKLPLAITEEDNKRFLDLYMKSAHK